jgi:hypothetical protein
MFFPDAPPTLCAQMVTPSGTPQGIQDCVPLPQTQQTPEKTQTVAAILAVITAAEPVIPSAAELNTKKDNIQTLRQLCEDVSLHSDGAGTRWSPD